MNISKMFLAIAIVFVGSLLFSGVEAAITYSDVEPADEYITSNQTPEVSFRPTSDIASNNISCRLYIDGAIDKEQTTINNSLTTIIPDNLAEGEHEWKVSCTDDNSTYYDTSLRSVTIGNILITDLEVDPDDPEVGEEVEVTFTVENLMDQDLVDVTITMEIDDLDIEQEVNGDEEIKDNDDEDYEFTFNIPCDADEDSYEIEITIEGEGDDDEDDYEITRTIDFDIDRETHDICLISSEISPTTIECGSSAELEIEVFNSGSRDEDDMYIIIENNELDIEIKSDDFDLDNLEDKKQAITFFVPEDVESKRYPLIVEVYYDDGDEYISTVHSLDVECIQPVASADLSIESGSLELEPGEEGIIEATIENDGDTRATFDITLSGLTGWAETEVIPSEVILDEEESETIIISIIPDEDAEGTKTLTLYAENEGSVLDSTRLTVEVPEEEETTPSEVEIISEGNAPIITGETIFGLESENVALGIAIVIALIIIGSSVFYNLKSE